MTTLNNWDINGHAIVASGKYHLQVEYDRVAPHRTWHCHQPSRYSGSTQSGEVIIVMQVGNTTYSLYTHARTRARTHERSHARSHARARSHAHTHGAHALTTHTRTARVRGRQTEHLLLLAPPRSRHHSRPWPWYPASTRTCRPIESATLGLQVQVSPGTKWPFRYLSIVL